MAREYDPKRPCRRQQRPQLLLTARSGGSSQHGRRARRFTAAWPCTVCRIFAPDLIRAGARPLAASDPRPVFAADDSSPQRPTPSIDSGGPAERVQLQPLRFCRRRTMRQWPKDRPRETRHGPIRCALVSRRSSLMLASLARSSPGTRLKREEWSWKGHRG